MQAPKFIVSEPNEDDAYSWTLVKDDGGQLVVAQGVATVAGKDNIQEQIKECIETAIGAAGVSLSLGATFNPIIEYAGEAEETTDENPVEEPPNDND